MAFILNEKAALKRMQDVVASGFYPRPTQSQLIDQMMEIRSVLPLGSFAFNYNHKEYVIVVKDIITNVVDLSIPTPALSDPYPKDVLFRHTKYSSPTLAMLEEIEKAKREAEISVRDKKFNARLFKEMVSKMGAMDAAGTWIDEFKIELTADYGTVLKKIEGRFKTSVDAKGKIRFNPLKDRAEKVPQLPIKFIKAI